MKKYRRIEITAFRRRVTIVSGAPTADNEDEQPETDVRLDDTDSLELIEPESVEGREILIEAVRLLEEKLSGQTERKIFKQHNTAQN